MTKQFVAVPYVKRAFNYGGTEYRQGDIFHPTGAPNDLKMLDTDMVRVRFEVHDVPEQAEQTATTTRKRSNKNGGK